MKEALDWLAGTIVLLCHFVFIGLFIFFASSVVVMALYEPVARIGLGILTSILIVVWAFVRTERNGWWC